jgi:hypothetical protein
MALMCILCQWFNKKRLYRMFDLTRKRISLVFNERDVSIYTISWMSILGLFLWQTGYAIAVFEQFSLYEIICVAIIFFVLFVVMTAIFVREFFEQKIKLSPPNILLSIGVLCFMIILSATWMTPSWLSYLRFFPLLEVDMGLGGNPDTIFHTAIIQNILNFGYPSTALHGTPVLFYHVLSHYVDAIVLFISGLEVYDSYGLLFQFKVFIFLAAIIVFVNIAIISNNPTIFGVSILIIAPIIVGTGHAIGSHSLWFTSIILILSSQKVFQALTKEQKNSKKDFIFLFFLVIVISLGKVSTGLMYSAFIGIYLLLKQPKDLSVYLLGIGWGGFFFMYQLLMVYTTHGGIDLSGLSFGSFYSYLVSPSLWIRHIYVSMIVLIAVAFIWRGKQNIIVLIAATGSVIILYVITHSNTKFGPSDIVYFEFGLGSVLILFVFQTIFLNHRAYKSHERSKLVISDSRLLKVSLLLSIIFLVNLFQLTGFNILNMGPQSIKNNLIKINISPFHNINSRLFKTEQISLKRSVINQQHLPVYANRPMLKFRSSLVDFLNVNHLTKREVLLFISVKIHNLDLKYFINAYDARTMLVYAVTGVPLIYGVRRIRSGYGFDTYTKDSLWRRNLEGLQLQESCNSQSAKAIVVIISFFEPEFSIFKCGT